MENLDSTGDLQPSNRAANKLQLTSVCVRLGQATKVTQRGRRRRVRNCRNVALKRIPAVGVSKRNGVLVVCGILQVINLGLAVFDVKVGAVVLIFWRRVACNFPTFSNSCCAVPSNRVFYGPATANGVVARRGFLQIEQAKFTRGGINLDIRFVCAHDAPLTAILTNFVIACFLDVITTVLFLRL